ncbi:MAG: ABC transporter permease [Halobacteria archaeon]|nr:ABC transporter permease [Halobacteria archaeon]
MISARRIASEAKASWRTFIRKRAAVFFTFVFPIMLVGLLAAVVSTQVASGAGGLFSKPVGYYIPGYLAIVVLFTPMERMASTVAIYDEERQFEKLSSTPLSAFEWLLAHSLVVTALVSGASLLILGVLLVVTSADIVVSPSLMVFVPAGVFVFSGIGAVIGSLADSQDGAIAAGNALSFPMIVLSETFVSPDLVPEPIQPLIDILPLTYFSRGVRAATYEGTSYAVSLGVLLAIAVVAFGAGVHLLPWRED